MMFNRIILILLISSALLSCTKDCTENQGKDVTFEFDVQLFNELIVKQGVEVHISQDNNQKVIVKTGENRLDNIYFNNNGNTLEIEADENCIFSEDYSPIQVYISHPNLISVRNAGEHTIYSDNVLRYPNMTLISENYQNINYSNYGNFNMKVENLNLTIISNGLSNFNIEGSTNHLFLGFYSGLGKFEGQNFVAQHIEFYHRGENTLKVFPVQSLVGNIYSVGNLISFNHPETVDVTEHYTGKLLYN